MCKSPVRHKIKKIFAENFAKLIDILKEKVYHIDVRQTAVTVYGRYEP